jgi:hypothetical protein
MNKEISKSIMKGVHKMISLRDMLENKELQKKSTSKLKKSEYMSLLYSQEDEYNLGEDFLLLSQDIKED